MSKPLFCLIVALAFSMTQLYAQTRKKLLGTWVSSNRADTMTLRFINDSIFYFQVRSTPEFNDSAEDDRGVWIPIPAWLARNEVGIAGPAMIQYYYF